MARVSRLKLMDQVSQLLVRLHPGGAWDRCVSRRNYFRSRSGRALYVAICNAHRHDDAPPSPPATSSPPLSPSPPGAQGEASLVLREVQVKRLDGRPELPLRNVLLLAHGPRRPACSLAGFGPSLRYTGTTGEYYYSRILQESITTVGEYESPTTVGEYYYSRRLQESISTVGDYRRALLQ
ncbi:hypothetical protein NHX12_030111 [Muraenolepis orangiensis]|uniref:Uncharacterized protein n=1 Tax=Muraenolepis orangiensis TaxID=630683 RepID=A0A9Q0ILK4_9TELE|nr:hypothetical protein NHX12_030111 [Muraenolepis orangiensis]